MAAMCRSGKGRWIQQRCQMNGTVKGRANADLCRGAECCTLSGRQLPPEGLRRYEAGLWCPHAGDRGPL